MIFAAATWLAALTPWLLLALWPLFSWWGQGELDRRRQAGIGSAKS